MRWILARIKDRIEEIRHKMNAIEDKLLNTRIRAAQAQGSVYQQCASDLVTLNQRHQRLQLETMKLKARESNLEEQIARLKHPDASITRSSSTVFFSSTSSTSSSYTVSYSSSHTSFFQSKTTKK